MSFIISNMYYKDYMSTYYRNNIEMYKEYYQVNKERLNKESIEYYYKNKVKVRERQNNYFKKYYELNKGKINASRKRHNKLMPYKIEDVKFIPTSLLVTF